MEKCRINKPPVNHSGAYQQLKPTMKETYLPNLNPNFAENMLIFPYL